MLRCWKEFMALGYIWNIKMMTSSNGNMLRVTWPLWGEFTGVSVVRFITFYYTMNLTWKLRQPMMRSFDVFFDLHLNKRLNKQSRRRWFETTSRSLWRHRKEWTEMCIPPFVCVVINKVDTMKAPDPCCYNFQRAEDTWKKIHIVPSIPFQYPIRGLIVRSREV